MAELSQFQNYGKGLRRIKNRDNKKGKSAGYRVIYYVKTATSVFLVTIYSKSEQSNIPAAEIRRILAKYE